MAETVNPWELAEKAAQAAHQAAVQVMIQNSNLQRIVEAQQQEIESLKTALQDAQAKKATPKTTKKK